MKITLKTSLAALLIGAGPLLPAAAGAEDMSAGAYLAAIHAMAENDFAKAAEYFTRALDADPENTTLMEDAVTAYVGVGQFDKALPVAEALAKAGVPSQMSGIVRVEEWAQAGEWQQILDHLDDKSVTIAPLVDSLVRGWAQVGLGDMSAAVDVFKGLVDNQGTRAFGLYHQALALALAGDYEAAEGLLSSDTAQGLTLTRRGVIARVEILSQLERDADAAKLLTDTFGTDLDPALQALKDRLDAGETLPMTVVTQPRDGLAEVFFTVATALNGEAPDTFVLGFARTAHALQPSHVDAILLTAGLLEKMQRYDLAITAYDTIPSDSDYFHVAELGRAEAMRRSGKVTEAIEVLRALAKRYDTLPAIFVTLGDALRSEERYEEAQAAYDHAIELFGEPREEQWTLYFSRGITEERQDDWAKAEEDFRTALKLRPDQPQVLNYLGYSYVEKGENLDEALDMIERAVKARPDDGYITDSLGWAYYKLGRYDEAVTEMERAVELVPVDPILSDHLGDVYWAVGRKREAEFQWKRALSFDPEPKDEDRIKRKLDVGLDQVLKEEGAEPLAVAKDG